MLLRRLLLERAGWDAAADGEGVGCHSGSGGGDVGVVQVDGGVLVAGLRGDVEADVGEVSVDEVGGADSADTGVGAGDGADGLGSVDDDVGVDGSTGGSAATAVVGVEDDEVLDVGHADVFVEDFVDGAAALGVRLDVDGVGVCGGSAGEVFAVDVVVVEEDVGDAVEGLASDGEAVRAVDARVFDGDVRGCRGVGFDGYSVVAGFDGGLVEGDVGDGVDVDAVGVGAGGGGADGEAPDSGAVAAFDVEVGMRGLLEGDVVDDEVIYVLGLDEAGCAGDDVTAAVDGAGAVEAGVVAGDFEQLGFTGVAVVAVEGYAGVDGQGFADDVQLVGVEGVVGSGDCEYDALAGVLAGDEGVLDAGGVVRRGR